MKVVMLCGGLGTRLREETKFRPKPMVEIGHRPILWYIMKMYSYYGFNEFILCLGYKGDAMRNYLSQYDILDTDLTTLDHAIGCPRPPGSGQSRHIASACSSSWGEASGNRAPNLSLERSDFQTPNDDARPLLRLCEFPRQALRNDRQ